MKKPVINKVMFIYLLLSGILSFVLSISCLKDAYFPSEALLQKQPSMESSFYLLSKVFAVTWALFGLLHLWLAKKIKLTHGSKRLWLGIMWLNLGYTLLIPLNLLFLINLFLLLFWCTGKNKKYHFESGNGEALEPQTENSTD